MNEINEKKDEKNNKIDENSSKIKIENPTDSKLEKLSNIKPNDDELKIFHKNQIEASLYVSGKPLNVEELSTKLEIPKKEVEELIKELAFDYLERSTSIVINQVGESFQMSLKPEYVEKVSKFAKGGAIADKYLRTLTIIALKQPILKSLVIKIRGSGAYDHIKYLIENGLINAVQKGRSQELNTTDKYAEMFGLPKDIEELKKVMISQLGIEKEENIDKNLEKETNIKNQD